MWIAMSDSFISVVEDRDDPHRLVVRARASGHLKHLFPSAEVLVTPKADYIARVFVSREDFTRVMIERVGEIKYDNFKMSVDDEKLHELYESFWSLHRSYQQDLRTRNRARHMSWGAGDVVFHPKRS